MEAVECCIDYIDDSNLAAVAAKLTNLIRKGVGLPTKAGCARFVTSLAMRQLTLLSLQSTEADQLLKALSGAVQDRSVAIRKSMAVASGYLIRACSAETGLKFLQHVRGLYQESGKFAEYNF
jgi:proteasome component ECM29